MIAPNDIGCGGAHNAEEAECQRLLALLRRITTDTNNSNANAASVSSSSSAPSGAAAFIFSNHNYLLNEDDTASLLSYLAKLRCCDNDNNNAGAETANANADNDNDNEASSGGGGSAKMEWSENNVQLVRYTVKAAMQSLNTSSSSTSQRMMIMDGKIARRILTDGILPLASSAQQPIFSSSSHFASSSFGPSFHPGQQPIESPSAAKTASTTAKIPPCIWIAKLIKSIVIEDLLPIALMPMQNQVDDTNNATNNLSGSSNSHRNDDINNNNTTALEILLSPFLTRMDADESSQIILPPPTSVNSNSERREDADEAISVDDILDRLSGFAIATHNSSNHNSSSNTTSWERLRPSSATSLIAALREFETSNASSTITTFASFGGSTMNSGSLGRLSRRRVWKLLHQQQHRGGGGQHSSGGESLQRYDIQYIYVDRPTSLLCRGLFSLQSLATIDNADTTGRNGGGTSSECDFDALPPLVYQLSLLPMSMTSMSSSALVSSSSESGKNGAGEKTGKVVTTHQESDKQRGVRLRRMCLEGIAYVLEDDNNCCPTSRRSSCRCTIIAPNIMDDSETPAVIMNSARQRDKEAYRWARYTSLSHLGNCLRSDPGLSKAMLSLLNGEIGAGDTVTKGMDHDTKDWIQPKHQRPFRYARLTPFKLAMGLSMATSVPRMRSSTLGAICDLILEEETLRTRRGLAPVDPFENDAGSDRNYSAKSRRSSSGRRQPWMDCLVRCLEMEFAKKKDGRSNTDNVVDDDFDDGIGHVLHCLLSVAKFAENEHGSSSFGMGGGGESLAGGGCASSLLQSLHQLGFLLIDCVKKDDASSNASPANKAHAMQSIAVLAPNLDMSCFDSNSGTHVASAPHAAAVVGRFLLCFLFYQSSSSSLSASSLRYSSSSHGGDGGTALCRSILRSSFDKFCGNAPNALEHALLVKDLLRFQPSSVRNYLHNDNSEGRESVGVNDLGWSSSGGHEQQMMIAFALTSNYLPSIIDTLSNLPGGGMSPSVASETIVPSLGCLLLLMAAPPQRGLVGSLWKRHDLEDHVNQTFLLAKKCLYATDVEKRKCAANMLAMLLGVASVAASVAQSKNGGNYTLANSHGGGSRSSSVWSSILNDIKGVLRRCLTQHQDVVRTEVYSALVALLPESAPNGDGSNHLSADTQDATSPASLSASGTRGSKTPSPKVSSFKNVFASIPPVGQQATICIVSELLLSSLERYITIPKEEITDREARRKRAAMGVGLSQMEMIVEEESDRVHHARVDDEWSNPFRFEKCISARPTSVAGGGDVNNIQRKGKKSQSKTPLGQALLVEAINRINEPLPFLMASCVAVASLAHGEANDCDVEEENERCNSTGSMEVNKAINRIRQQFARCTDIQEHLKWIKTNRVVFDIKDNTQRAKEMAISKLATLMLVSAVADSLINSCDLKGEKRLTHSVIVMDSVNTNDVAKDIEDLFSLRTDAIEEAAAIMSSFVAKPVKAASDSSSKGKKKKALKDVNANSSSIPSEQQAAETKIGKSAELTKLKSNDIKHATLVKNRRFIENALGNTCPAINQDFLADSLRKFGAGMSKTLEDDAEYEIDGDHDNDVNISARRLPKCLVFRRFIITKTLLLMSGSSSVVKAGARFAPFAPASGGPSSRSKLHIAASLLLGPLLFVEFCSHCYDIELTSIETSKSSSLDLSLAQLSLRAFTACVRGMTIDAGYHSLSKAARVNALLNSAIRKVSTAVPSADGWEFYTRLECNTHRLDGASNDEVELSKTLLPFLSLAMADDNVPSGRLGRRICLLSELILNCMHGEAMECCNLISSAAEAFDDANCREQLGVYLLRAFELGQQEQAIGVLGIDHSDVSKDNNSCVSAAIRVAIKLNGGLDGNTQVPLTRGLSQDRIRLARSKMGLSTTAIENWPESHRQRLEKEAAVESGMIGIATQLAWALSAGSPPAGKHFSNAFNNAPTKKQLKLTLIKSASQTSEANFTKEKASIACTISSTIDGALNNADFVTLKLIPHMTTESVDLAQRYVSDQLFCVSKMISLSAPTAESLNADGNFASTLLKSTKHMYGVLTKLIFSFLNNPSILASKETKDFIDYLTATLMPRVSALLRCVQEKQQTTGGKFLAESKIESHGKTSALLVFEKEKLDNAFLTVGAKLKQSGLQQESEWLENHVVANLNPDFTIKRVAEARAREAPVSTKNKAGAKRKAALGQANLKKKRVVPDEESESENDADDDSVIESVDGDDFMDDDEDVISLSKLTADMNDEQNSDNNSDRSGSESESEAEFD